MSENAPRFVHAEGNALSRVRPSIKLGEGRGGEGRATRNNLIERIIAIIKQQKRFYIIRVENSSR